MIIRKSRNRDHQLYSVAYRLLLENYDKMIKAKGYRQKKTYQNNVKEFLNYLERQGKIQIGKVTTQDLINYYEYISTRPSYRNEGVLSGSTISQHLFSLALLFDYLVESGQIDKRIIIPKHNRGQGKQRDILSVDEVIRLYEICETKRDRAILSIAYGCAVRRAEIVKLNIADVQLSIGIIIVRNGKNDKRREIPIPDTIKADLKDYLFNERSMYVIGGENAMTEAFFVNNRGLRMRGEHINERVRELIDKIGDPELSQKEITLHSLRHSLSTHLLDNGATIEFVKDYLGHSGIDTTHIYVKRRKQKQHLSK